MAKLNVNPTRMELKRLKARLKTATRGHKLLKDKSDEMIRQFSILIRKNKILREEVEKGLSETLSAFTLARSKTSEKSLEVALAMPSKSVELTCGTKNIMSVSVPDIKYVESTSGELFPYSFSSMTAETDTSITELQKVLIKSIELAEIEKACNMLAIEIEKNKRRVNALEYVMIPQLEETIKYIRMKLEENDRAATTRIMKVKDMIANRDAN